MRVSASTHALLANGEEVLIGGVPYTVEAFIGSGGTATVFRVCSPTGTRFALKMAALADTKQESLKREADILERLTGIENVPRYIWASQLDVGYGMLMELVPSRDLQKVCDNNNNLGDLFPDFYVATMLHSVATTLKACEDKNVFHGDVSPSQIVVQDGRFNLLDWGSANQPTVSAKCLYMAPEDILRFYAGQLARKNKDVSEELQRATVRTRDGFAADIYMLGCSAAMLYCPATRIHFYVNMMKRMRQRELPPSQIQGKVLMHRAKQILDGKEDYHDAIQSMTSKVMNKKLLKLIADMMSSDPAQRPSLLSIIQQTEKLAVAPEVIAQYTTVIRYSEKCADGTITDEEYRQFEKDFPGAGDLKGRIPAKQFSELFQLSKKPVDKGLESKTWNALRNPFFTAIDNTVLTKTLSDFFYAREEVKINKRIDKEIVTIRPKITKLQQAYKEKKRSLEQTYIQREAAIKNSVKSHSRRQESIRAEKQKLQSALSHLSAACKKKHTGYEQAIEALQDQREAALDRWEAELEKHQGDKLYIYSLLEEHGYISCASDLLKLFRRVWQ